jgi:hypothetical protein
MFRLSCVLGPWYKKHKLREALMTFVFKHPKYYKELRARNKSDQAISCAIGRRPSSGRAPGQGLKPQAASDKLQAPSDSSNKPQASSPKQQASSSKPQATSSKI